LLVPAPRGRAVAPRDPRAPTASLVIGLNFQTSQRGVDTNAIPPDTMGAVGPNHIVEIINFNFEIFQKSDGTQIDLCPLDGLPGC
jgi:hypothetical protein